MKKFLSLILCSVVVFTLAACGKTEVKDNTTKSEVKEESTVATKVEKPAASTVTPTVKPAVKNEDIKSREVVLYFSDDQAMYFASEKRTITSPTAKSIVEELVKGPATKSGSTAKSYATLPTSLQVSDVQIKEKIAYVNLKSELKVKGSAGEQMALFSIVNTLILDKELGVTKVQFLLAGEKVKTIGGQYDVSEPMSENKEMMK
ncbi:GerMN domain-containing protein [Clostridium estertheticum]|uniref:GerMN domain-containing protein n=1 Tax=Clostridium estertheticum TaxID=238834 RepID=UPI001CF55023|nr:GerMN domain-containing protein [Clostridium estertheticum]MCB2354505.1 GerMN domain-containing protein [Clostridium estertheticum]WAG42384.1 GerMN domain-containing protein [Clostridium estertheticum]